MGKGLRDILDTGNSLPWFILKLQKNFLYKQWHLVVSGKPGLLAMVSVMGGKSPLRTLYLQTQNSGSQLTEPDMIELYTKLAQNLGQYELGINLTPIADSDVA